MKKAGTKHNNTCSRAYHRIKANASCTAASKRGTPTGSQKHAANTAAMTANTFHSRFHMAPAHPSCACPTHRRTDKRHGQHSR